MKIYGWLVLMARCIWEENYCCPIFPLTINNNANMAMAKAMAMAMAMTIVESYEAVEENVKIYGLLVLMARCIWDDYCCPIFPLTINNNANMAMAKAMAMAMAMTIVESYEAVEENVKIYGLLVLMARCIWDDYCCPIFPLTMQTWQ